MAEKPQEKLELVRVVFVRRRDDIDVYSNSASLHIMSDTSDSVTYCSILIHSILSVYIVSEIPVGMCTKCQRSVKVRRFLGEDNSMVGVCQNFQK